MKKIKERIKIYLQRFFVIIYGKTHKIQKKVLFESFNGKQYSDNTRTISEKLHELYPEFEIVWKINNLNENIKLIIPEYVRIVNKIQFFKELATCFAYVTNGNMIPNKYKKKGQFFVQTWHADRAIKRVLYDNIDENEGKRLFPITDNKVTDLCVAGSDLGEEVYRTAFKYKGEVLKVGSPRNDALVNANDTIIKNIKKKLNLNNGKKILLYAPTFRDYLNSLQKIDVDIENVLKILNEKEDWICLIRTHSMSKGFEDVKNDRIINVTNYPDMTDLLLISDMLITDYSSSASDYILLHRPVILAMFDRKEYEEKCRKFRIDPDEAGFITAYNQEELNSILKNYTEQDFEKSCEKLFNYFKINETGKSAEEICYRINKEWTKFKNNH